MFVCEYCPTPYTVYFSDSPVLSLLVQNKGKNPLTISISAPKSVQLDTTEVQLQENRNTEVCVNTAQ